MLTVRSSLNGCASQPVSCVENKVDAGSMKFNSEPRRTMECMFVRGASGPGSGKRLGSIEKSRMYFYLYFQLLLHSLIVMETDDNTEV